MISNEGLKIDGKDLDKPRTRGLNWKTRNLITEKVIYRLKKKIAVLNVFLKTLLALNT
jgi:hypothetical protein